MPYFSFESMDTTAYPYLQRQPPTPCAERLAGRPAEDIESLLESAGEERLRRKAEHLAAAIEQRGEEQALYEETLSPLGYKHNRTPFRQLAGRVPLHTLREETKPDPPDRYALLLGVAGLMPLKFAPAWDAETRAYVRRLWDVWWKKKRPPGNRGSCRHGSGDSADCGRRIIPCGASPPPPPFSSPATWLDRIHAVSENEPAAWLAQITAILAALPAGGYWSRRLGFSSAPRPQAIALIGRGRAAAIVSNVVAPFAAATSGLPPPARISSAVFHPNRTTTPCASRPTCSWVETITRASPEPPCVSRG